MDNSAALGEALTALWSQKPTPQPFAIVRIGHDVIRGMMKDCELAKGVPPLIWLLAVLRCWKVP
eukprot:3260981-Rhodomonas_salina.1